MRACSPRKRWKQVRSHCFPFIALLLLALVEFLANTILFVRAESKVTDHLTLQAGQHKLHAKDHQQDTNQQQRLVADRLVGEKTAAKNDREIYQDTQQECPEAEWHEETQRLAQEGGQKQDIQ